MEENFRGAVIVDEHSTMINYEVPKASISRLSAAFSLLEGNKAKLGIVDYALSQSTLEQVSVYLLLILRLHFLVLY